MKPRSSTLKRSNAPTFWLLFGAGGMLSALIGPMLVFITGIALPLGWLFGDSALGYPQMHVVVSHIWVRIFLFSCVSLFLWHAGHRLFHSLHDVGIHAGIGARLLFYGGPVAATLIAAIVLWQF